MEADPGTPAWSTLEDAFAEVLVGQKLLVRRLLIALATGGHVLLEGVPGVAKTLAARTLADLTGLAFGRVQFTPDLLPADLVGTEVFHPATGEFTVRQGPIFRNIFLADEINRAPAKVQSALLEAMQERQVTLGGQTFPLPMPFLVLATQNPIEHHGTYPLPEAQLDRFLMKVVVEYPDREEERAILDRYAKADRSAVSTASQAELDLSAIASLPQAVDRVHLDPRIADYIVDLVRLTRERPEVEWGIGPRGGLALALAARANALFEGRNYVVPHDVKSVALDVLRHRLIPRIESFNQPRSADVILRKLLDETPVP